jgi:DNA-binding FadR family transcriptional regulator
MSNGSTLLVSRVTQRLREQVISAEPGTYLGSEAELVKRFNVSRPTFRQAAKLVEQENLLVIKTGAGGGYFVRRPDSAAVAHMTAVYLQSRKTTTEHMIAAFMQHYVAVAATAAAQRREGPALTALAAFAQGERSTLAAAMDWNTYIASQETFVDILSDVAGNPVMKLFLDITRELTAGFLDKIAPFKPANIARARTLRIKLVEAISDGEPEIAEVLARKYTVDVENWVLGRKVNSPR